MSDDGGGGDGQSPLVSVWSLDSSLSGSETQNLRRVIKRCRMALTAIHVTETMRPPLMEMILPLAFQSPHILHGLLSLSVRPSERSSVNLQHHHLALSELRADIEAAKLKSVGIDHVHRLLASSLLLNLFTLSLCDGSWPQHIRGMVSLIRSIDQTALGSTPLGRFLMSQCAFQDISAFSAGRPHASQKAWLSWMLPRAKERLDGALTALETTVGYPESLIDIIAQVSERADDQANYLFRQALSGTASPGSATSSQAAMSTWTSCDDLETTLCSWTLPSLPDGMTQAQQLTLRTAWETFRKAALLFLWRGCGFHSNLLEPMRADKQARRNAIVNDIATGVRVIMDMCRMHQLSLGNTMLWPIAVAGCECLTSLAHHRQGLLALLDDMVQLFSMDHPRRMMDMLDRLWGNENSLSLTYASLEQTCNEMQLVIPLF